MNRMHSARAGTGVAPNGATELRSGTGTQYNPPELTVPKFALGPTVTVPPPEVVT